MSFSFLVVSLCCFCLQIELFRELQLLTSDYLRQRALYALQDLVTRFLTEDSLAAGTSGPLVTHSGTQFGTRPVSID